MAFFDIFSLKKNGSILTQPNCKRTRHMPVGVVDVDIYENHIKMFQIKIEKKYFKRYLELCFRQSEIPL